MSKTTQKFTEEKERKSLKTPNEKYFMRDHDHLFFYMLRAHDCTAGARVKCRRAKGQSVRLIFLCRVTIPEGNPNTNNTNKKGRLLTTFNVYRFETPPRQPPPPLNHKHTNAPAANLSIVQIETFRAAR